MFSQARFHQWLWAATGAVAAAVLVIAVWRPGVAAEQAAADASTLSSAPYRGFNSPDLNPAVLPDIAKWNANIVRYDIRPVFMASRWHCSRMEAWQRLMHDNLPAVLDTAKRLHLAIVLALFEIPTDNFPVGEDHAGWAAFWDDESNLQAMTQAWNQIATICANRDQVIWFDLKNEPVNWGGPGSPKTWPLWAQSLINSIRQIDQQHQIVIEARNGGAPRGFINFPKLTGEGLIYSFHEYEPREYTYQGGPGLKDPDLAQAYLRHPLSWPGTYADGYWDKHRIERQLQPAVDFQKRYGVRMYVGEFSVVRWAPDAAQWLRDNIDIFEKHGWDWTYHGFRDDPRWSVEYTHDYQNARDLKDTGEMTERGKLLLDYFSRNEKQ